MQFASGWLSPVIVFGASRRPRKTPVVFRQILFSQVLVRRFVVRDLLPSHFLDQPILMHSVGAFYAALGLGRTGRNDADAQLFTHTSELCERHVPPQLLGWRGLPLVDVLPIGIERTRHAMVLDPGPQYTRRRPNRLFLAHTRFAMAGGVIHHVHQAAPRAAPFKPIMETAIQLHELAKMGFALPPFQMLPTPSLPTPQPFFQHPQPQRFVVHDNAVFFG